MKPFTCAHGRTLAKPCDACAVFVNAGVREFWRLVKAGVLNSKGYTEREWIASGRSRETWRTAA